MGRLGSYLRELRESRGISLEEISKATRIGKGHVEALEGEDVGALPAPVFVKGFIRAYCRELHAAEDEAIERYRELVGEPPPAPRPAATRPRSPGGHRGTLTISAVLLVVLAGGLLLLSGRATRLSDIPPGPPPMAGRPQASEPSPPAAAPAASPVAAAQPEPPTGASATPIPAPAVVAPPPAAAVPPLAGGPRRLHVRASERTWIRVQADEAGPQDATLEPGATREWTATRRFLLTVGNAGGIELTLDGRRLAPLGARGAVIRDLILPEGAPGAGS
jgi:cytoskeletal protein RodZ